MNPAELHESILREAVLSFSRSGGPGGQNVNKVNTKVTVALRLDLLSGLSPLELERVQNRLSSRINEQGEFTLQADEERSQLRNREIALERIEGLIKAASRPEKKRIPTRPGKSAILKRLKTKKIRSQIKAERTTHPDKD